jgi:hypothetical protein
VGPSDWTAEFERRRSTAGSQPSKCHTNFGFDVPVNFNRLGRVASLPLCDLFFDLSHCQTENHLLPTWTDFRILLNLVQFAADQQLRVRFVSNTFCRSQKATPYSMCQPAGPHGLWGIGPKRVRGPANRDCQAAAAEDGDTTPL